MKNRHMDKQTTQRKDIRPKVAEPSIYEQMWRYMYDYRFGRITFLELLDKWKEVLSLPTNRE